MLSDKLRDGANSKGFKALLAIILFSFVLTGVGGYLIPRLNTDPVKIGDYAISNNAWTEQYNRRAQQLHQMGPQAAALLENPDYVVRLKNEILENMIDNAAFNSTVWEMNVRIGDEQVRDVIRKTPSFQQDGKFNNDIYLATLRNMGMNPEYFGEQLRLSLMSQTVSTPIMELSSIPMPYETAALSKLFAQKRVVDLYTVDSADIAKNMQVSEDEAKAYFDAHHDQFMAPANVRFTYLLLSTEELKDQVEVTPEKLEEFFNLYQDDFALGEQRKVSHILIRKDTEGAEQKIKDIEQGLAEGKKFADLAKQYSDDNASKDKGGDMGLVARGQLDESLDTVLFSMKNVGDVSKPIEDAYGTHFIALTAIEPAHTPSFKEVESKVKIAFINAKARELFNSKVTTMSDLSFENPDSLDTTAEALGLKIQDSGLLDQGDMKAKWPLNTKAVQDLAFDEDVYTSGVNSTVISIDDDTSIVINVSEHHDKALKNYDDVKNEALAKVKQSKINEESLKVLTDLGNTLKKNPDAPLPQNIKVESDVELTMGASQISRELSFAVFAMPQDQIRGSVVGNNNGQQTMAILKSIQESDEASSQAFNQLIYAQLSQVLSLNTQKALYRQARNLNEIEYNQEAIQLVTRTNTEM